MRPPGRWGWPLLTMNRGRTDTTPGVGVTPADPRAADDTEVMRSLFRRLTASPVTTARAKKKKTSSYRGVCWSELEQGWRAVIEVDRVRYRLGVFKSEKDAALAFDAAAEALNVPQRRNFGAHDPYPDVVVCGRCAGLGRLTGEHLRKRRDGGTYIARMGPGKDCPTCGGSGYFLKEQKGER